MTASELPARDAGTVPLPFRRGALVGMVHLRPLPGTPRWPGRSDAADAMHALVQAAIADARALVDAGFDALLVENMHDAPYLRRDVGPEIVSAMTAATMRVVDAVDLPVGVQILAGANRAALAAAFAAGAAFIRAEGTVFAAIADEGMLDEADAGPLLRFRRAIGAGRLPILADIRKKHTSHAMTDDLSVADWAAAAEFAAVDGVIVTGSVTGAPADIVDIEAARRGARLPVGVGSGVTVGNVAAMLQSAEFAIVGSSIKLNGDWRERVDPTRAAALVHAARR